MHDLLVVAQAEVLSPAQGVYTYTVTVPGIRRISIVAGSDLDNDGFICNSGEACGAYPTLGTTFQVLEPTGNLTGIDFTVIPVGGINAGSTAATAMKAMRQ